MSKPSLSAVTFELTPACVITLTLRKFQCSLVNCSCQSHKVFSLVSVIPVVSYKEKGNSATAIGTGPGKRKHQIIVKGSKEHGSTTLRCGIASDGQHHFFHLST